MTRKDSLGSVFMALYVDDCLTIGDSKAIDATINHLKEKGLSLKAVSYTHLTLPTTSRV